MMKISYPEATDVVLFRQNGEKFTERLDLGLVVQKFVLGLDICREKANVKIARALLSKLSARELLKDEEHEALEKWMRLTGTQVSPELNPYYLECLDAVYDAQKVTPQKDKDK